MANNFLRNLRHNRHVIINPTRVVTDLRPDSFSTIVQIFYDMEDNGEEKDQDTIKLFVGQIPRTYTEDDLREIFQEYGAIHDITVLREKATNAHRGQYVRDPSHNFHGKDISRIFVGNV